MKSKNPKLRQVADFDTGYQFRGKVEPFDETRAGRLGQPAPAEELVQVIQIKDFDDDHRLTPETVVTVQLDRWSEKHQVHQGDVLFLARGHQLFAAVVDQPVGRAIASGYFFIMRPKADTVGPEYLAWWINQPRFQAALKPLMRGTHIPLVSKSDVQSLRIPIPPLSVQRSIVELDQLRLQEQKLLAAVQKKRSQLIQAISMKAARRPS
ncbi:MAG: restriction endonuclease subunit S [Planctomycetota bacterium]|nr:MAG: restriction endonuclease subunit S [Planctomycetota bacterium]REK28041.1 MAG: restriction endonuclease subunit S [Planctomycetota bacterium]REK37568.1 MAG: restriction endonuclease subunit S [Planctomycetota bacterium]